MTKYLYGVSVQGIQDFIFKTNKLKEIIGASEIVKSIDEIDLKKEFQLASEPKIIMKAAGNLRYVFDNKEDLQKVVLNLPKRVMQMAYGITISQGVVSFEGESSKKDLAELISKLKIQRNKIALPLDMNFSILKRNPKTGKPSIEKSNSLDKASIQKISKFEENTNYKETLFDIGSIKNKANKIAIIHADGNGLGNVVKDKGMDELRDFSKKLDEATKEAFQNAKSVLPDTNNGKYKKCREVILGGDDLTLICDASYALEFTKAYLEEFEKLTNTSTLKGLTACAGIAICNQKYPLHYALTLAEDLCSQSKNHAKSLMEKNKESKVPSCLMFHNIQSSAVKNFSNFIKDELTIKGKEEDKRLDFGPYYLSYKNEPKIEDFLGLVEEFKQNNSPKGKLRNWLNELEYDEEFAKNQLLRIAQMSKENAWRSEYLSKLNQELNINLGKDLKLFVKKDGFSKSPLYDVLEIVSTKGDDK